MMQLLPRKKKAYRKPERIRNARHGYHKIREQESSLSSFVFRSKSPPKTFEFGSLLPTSPQNLDDLRYLRRSLSEGTESTQRKHSLSSGSDTCFRPSLNVVASNMAYECGSELTFPFQRSRAIYTETLTDFQTKPPSKSSSCDVPQIVAFDEGLRFSRRKDLPQSVTESPSIGFLSTEYFSRHEEAENLSMHLNIRTPKTGSSRKASMNRASVPHVSTESSRKKPSDYSAKSCPKLKPSERDSKESNPRGKVQNNFCNEKYDFSEITPPKQGKPPNERTASKVAPAEHVRSTDLAMTNQNRKEDDSRVDTQMNPSRIVTKAIKSGDLCHMCPDRPANFSLIASPVVKQENHTVNVELSDWSLEVIPKCKCADERSFVTTLEKAAPEVTAGCEWESFGHGVRFTFPMESCNKKCGADSVCCPRDDATLVRLTHQLDALLNRVTSLERTVHARRSVRNHETYYLDQPTVPAQDTAFIAEDSGLMNSTGGHESRGRNATRNQKKKGFFTRFFFCPNNKSERTKVSLVEC